MESNIPIEEQKPKHRKCPDYVLDVKASVTRHKERVNSTRLVEETLVHIRYTHIGPSSMDQQQLSQEPELPERIVG